MRKLLPTMLIKSASIASALLAVAGLASAATLTTVNLTAQRGIAALPDGSTVPMWGYCTNDTNTVAGAAAGTTVPNPNLGGGALLSANPCTVTSAANVVSTNTAWAPGPTIVVPAGNTLTINLSNKLPVSTSLTIVGQIGGTDTGLPVRAASPTHAPQATTTWNANGTASIWNPQTQTATAAPFTPPAQGMRARSFGPEAAALTGSQTYSWLTNVASVSVLKPGTYLYQTGTHPSLQQPMGLYGVLIVTTAPVTSVAASATAGAAPLTTVTTAGQAYPGTLVPGSNTLGTLNANVPYDADATFLLSEIDAVQNAAVDAAAQAGTSETLLVTDPTCIQSQQLNLAPAGSVAVPCYPPAVNYRPTYFLINGSPFNAANPAATTGVVADGALTGNVLVRFVNAGSRLHVPSIAGQQLAVLSEDGNVAPGLPKLQSEVNLPPGRTADVLITPASNGVPAVGTTPATAPTAYTDQAFSVFDRALSLAGANLANAGMHGYLAVAPAGANATAAATNAFLAGATGGVATATASAANYTFTIAPGVLPTFTGNVAVNSVGLSTVVMGATLPTKGNVTWGAGGTFTYTPITAPLAVGAPVGTFDTFTYCNAGSTLCGTVTLTVATEAASIAAPTTAPTYTSTVATLYNALTRAAGVLSGYKSSDGYPLTAALVAGSASNCSAVVNPDGSFFALPTSRPTLTTTVCTFSFTATDPRNPATVQTGTATVNFPAPSNLSVTVQDALNGISTTPNIPAITDYMWIIQEDRTFHNATPGVTPAFTYPTAANSAGTTPPPTLAVSFHQSHMPVIAAGCTGPLSCGDGSGGQKVQGLAACSASSNTTCSTITTGLANYTSPADAVLDPTKYYYISILPGDAANPVVNAYAGNPMASNGCLYSNFNANPSYLAPSNGTLANDCGHTMGGAEITPATVTTPATTAVTVKVEPNPLKPATLSVFIFEDNSPTNNDYDANEIGLGGFQIIVNDVGGRSGDPVGQVTFDAFNMPLSNSLLGVQGCPNETPAGAAAVQQTNLVGVVYTCPDGDRPIASVTVAAGLVTVTTSVAHNFANSIQGATPTIDIGGLGSAALNGSFTVNITGPNTFTYPNPGVAAGTPVLVVKSAIARDATTYQLAGQALINSIMPGRYDVIAHPAAYREGAGETWYQTSTLEGTPGQDAFTKANEPNFFQEFGPPGFHTFIGWLNPAHIADQNAVAIAQAAAAAVPPAAATTTVISGSITSLHMSRTIMETLWDSANNASIKQSTCFVAVNQVGETGNDIAFTACDSNGNFTLPAIPAGNQYELVVWDQWLDQIIAFKNLTATQTAAPTLNVGHIPVFSWFTRVEASVYLDTNGNGVHDSTEPGIPLVPVKIHFRDGSISNTLITDGNGNAVFNELFPLFNWYVVESDRLRYASTGVNVTVDAGGIPDCVAPSAAGSSQNVLSTTSKCPTTTATNAGTTTAMALGARTGSVSNSSYVWTDPTTNLSYGAVPTGAATSTNRIDKGTNATNGVFEGLQTFINQTQMLDYGRRNFKPGETGGIQGMVVYSSTRGFDDPSLQLQNLWEPGVPRVVVNLYSEHANADGTTGYTFVESTTSTSWDDWANLVKGSDGANYILGADNVLRSPITGLPAAAGVTAGAQVNMSCPGQDSKDPYVPYSLGTAQQFKCYDGFHMWNQVQPAVFDGAYLFTTLPDGVTPIPAGNYVVEIVPPPGYELVKEEDKNILIGDQWIAPTAQQFATMSQLFIMPDQASLASAYNPNNPGNNNTTMGLDFTQPNQQYAKCVGTPHQVPDFMSLFPISGQVAPFAGAMKNLCDRKEVVLNDQSTGTANFFIFTKTPRSSHFTGLMLDDAAAEINAAAPDFGEKFAASYAPIAIRDFNGVEMSRVYTDQWGTYNGMIYSTWQVNVPNPAGYSPNMMVTCMNDPGPIVDPRKFLPDGKTANPTYGQLITDPLYNPSYSNFCYTNPFMPGMTVYLDTPILPVAAFAAGYNPPDCALPATTPAIKRVDTAAGIGPWLTSAGGLITITAQGDVQVPNPNYQGPSANTAPFNVRTITRHYGFGAAQGVGHVTFNGANLLIVGWNDATITATVPANTSTTAPVSGELLITGASGLNSVDTVTLTVLPAGAAAPVVVEPPTSVAAVTGNAHPIQDAINAAKPGDLIIVDAGTYPELVVMWKPVRLQGVGAGSVVINAAKYPTQKLQNWRPLINQYFGVDTVAGNQVANSQVDPLPNQEITGGIVLLEPSVLATEEGAGITVLAKDPESVGADSLPNALCPASVLPGTKVSSVLTSSYPDQVLFPPTSNIVKTVNTTTLMSDSNFTCAPSRIDGVSVTGGDSGGGIYVNGWAHGLEIANNRVYGNAGSFNGGIRVGIPYLEGLGATPIAADGTVFGYDVGVNIHHNQITNNGTVEANPGTVNASNSSGVGGGLSICTGTDNYKVQYNYICGNYSTGDGGGIGQTGVSNNGLIGQNTIIFNQSYQQTSQVNGGGIVIEGEVGTIGSLSLGTGSVNIDGNTILGNFAQAGHGGGIRLQQVNGTDVTTAPANQPEKADRAGTRKITGPWYQVNITNNMITNNVAGWGGGGISAVDSLAVTLANNTITKNDSVGIVGTMIGGDPLNHMASGQPSLANTTGYPSPAGVSVDKTSPSLLAGVPAAQQAANVYSSPLMFNNIVWQNRSFYFAIVPQAGAAQPINALCPSNSVLDAYSLTCTPLAKQTAIGQCVNGAAYWDMGTTDDASANPGSNGSAFALLPTYSVLTTPAPYNTLAGAANVGTDPNLAHPYCNGARANPAFIFEPGQPFLDPATQNLSAGATLDEAGNYVDVRFGPLYTFDPTTTTTISPGNPIGDYHLLSGTGGAFNDGAPITGNLPRLAADINGDRRPQARGGGTSGVDIGADEFQTGRGALAATFNPTSLAFGNVPVSATAIVTSTGTAATVTMTNTGINPLPVSTVTLGGNNFGQFAISADTCVGTTLTEAPVAGGVGSSCTISVSFSPTSPGNKTARISVTSNGTTLTTQTIVALTGTGVQPTAALAPNPLAFGSRGVNTTATQTVLYTNTSAAGSVTIATVAVTNGTGGGGVAQFATTGCVNATVAAGASCAITVTFTPTSAGLKTANVRVTDQAGGALVALAALTGTGVAPTATLAGSGAFGNVLVNTSTTAMLTYTNNGPGPLTVNSVTIGGGFGGGGTAQFAATGCAGAVLQANTSCPITVTFTPTSAGAKGATLTVRDTAGGAVNAAATLTGSGVVPAINLGGGTLNVGAVTGTTTLTLTNTGSAPLAISAIGIAPTNTGTGTYAINGGTCLVGGTVAAGGTCTVGVLFTAPAVASTTNATVTVKGTAVNTTTPVYTTTRNLTGT